MLGGMGLARGGFGGLGRNLGGASGPSFFVATGGSDAADGKTPATAWQTISKVNASIFAAGTRVLFNGGQSFTGSIALTNTNCPLGNVTIGSYGTGQATISSGTSAEGLKATNVPGVRVSNLICTGAGTATNTTNGILIQNTGVSQLAGPVISGCTVSGYGQNGIFVSGDSKGFTSPQITGNTIHDCTGKTGVFTSGAQISAAPNFTSIVGVHTNALISGNTIFNVNGYAGAANWTGIGVWIEACQGYLIAFNTIHDTGANSNTATGPGGVLVNDSDSGTIQFNETYNNLSAGGDGDGIDLDGNVTNTMVQYNYVHDCVGFGLYGFNFVARAWGGNTFRFNIVVNCGKGIGIQQTVGANAITNTYVHNNTVYVSGPSAIGITSSGASVQATFSNNIVYGLGPSVGSLVSIPSPTSQVFTGNNYYGNGNFSWNGSNYSTFAAWQTATGQEKISSVNVGSNVEPRLVVYGYEGTTSGYNPSSLTQYQLQAGSPMLGAGIDVTAQYGINIGATDYFGVPISSSSKVIGAGQQVAWAGAASATSAQAIAAINRMTAPSVAQQQDTNAIISGLLIDGYTPVALYNLASDTAVNAVLNLMSSSFALTPTNSPTFTAFRGFQGDGSTSYLASTFNPSTAGSTYVLNSAAQFFYIVNSRTNSTYVSEIGGNAGGNSADAFLPGGGSAPAWDLNNASASPYFIPAANADVQGFWINSRTGASAGNVSKNGASLGAFTQISTALPNITFDVLGANAAGVHSSSSDQQCCAGWGPGMTATQEFFVSWRINASATSKGINAF